MTIKELTQQVFYFRERRDWAQYHHPKELASALSIEVAEVMELFRFKTAEEVKEMVKSPAVKEELGGELADTLFLLLLLAHESDIDLQKAFSSKLELLEERYPEDKARGRNDKWTAYTEKA